MKLIVFITEVTKTVAEGRAAGIVYVDLIKAFDQVLHAMLV